MEREPADQWRGEDPDGEPDVETAEQRRLLDQFFPILTDEEVEESDRRAMEDIAAGRVYPHALVSEWLRTAGEPGYRPFKEWLAARNG